MKWIFQKMPIRRLQGDLGTPWEPFLSPPPGLDHLKQKSICLTQKPTLYKGGPL